MTMRDAPINIRLIIINITNIMKCTLHNGDSLSRSDKTTITEMANVCLSHLIICKALHMYI